MKKILACMSLVFALSAGATALADENVIDVSQAYNSTQNSLTVSGAGATEMNTILITKDDVPGSDGIVFADQNDDTFVGVTTGFLLKGNSLEAGDYTVTMNKKDGGEPTVKSFSISNNEPQSEMYIKTVAFTYAKKDSQGNPVYDTGFTAENANLTGMNYIAITNTTKDDPDEGKTAYFDLDTTLTNASANIAIRINNIPEGKTVSVKLVANKPGTSGN